MPNCWKIKTNPSQGAEIKENCFKIRLAIKSKGKGKSGGGRVVTTFFKDDEIIYLLAIYDKSEKVSLSDKELENLLKIYPSKLSFSYNLFSQGF